LPFLVLLFAGTVFVVRRNAKNNPLQEVVEAALLREARTGARAVRLSPIGEDDLALAHCLSKETGTRLIHRLEIPGMRPIHSRDGDLVHLFALAGPGRARRIHAAFVSAAGDVTSCEILTATTLLQDPRLHMFRRAIIRAIETTEKRRFLDWMEEARKRDADPWILRHVKAWARRAAKNKPGAPTISDDTDANRFFKAVGACGSIEPLLELERYLDHRTDADLGVEDELVTFSDIARAIEFFGGRKGPRPGDAA